ncbi:methyl-accepting chemotaxis protein [Scopulibacillus darangshiensis]|uniref:Methyl-accepting chemotaxis protein n=1 Tax=Scopulibacillus darangshiensis TaxID=442528 RepID=A0A4R2PAE5_9BACL|nr:methyl-accepting chemotaxis protein [Scopulibacillus darangshiensis]TCP32033.1 methyl-accepting chemotaxis protein [Scopulibacillus darangshiensis]
MNWTMKRKIGAILIMGIAGMVTLGLFMSYSFFMQKGNRQKISTLNQNVYLSQRINLNMQKARKNEQAYLSNPSDEQAQKILTNIKEMEKDTKRLDKGASQIKSNIKAIEKGIRTYKDGVNQLISIKRQVGYTEKDGLRASLIASKKKLSKLVSKINSKELKDQLDNTILIEKDFLSYPTKEQFERLSKELGKFDKLNDLIPDEYATEYNLTFLNYKSQIDSYNSSLNFSSDMVEQFNKFSSQVQTTIDKVMKKFNEQKSKLTGKITVAQNTTFIIILVVSVLLILTLVIFGMLLLKSIAESLKVLNKGARELSNGNLNHRVPIISKDELAEFAKGFNTMAESMENTIRKVYESAQSLSASSENLAAISQETMAQSMEVNDAASQVAAGAQEQAEHLDQGMGLLSNVTSAIKQSEGFSRQVYEQTVKTETKSKEGLNTVRLLESSSKQFLDVASTLISDIKETAKASEQITNIIKTIRELSNSTNLLALNAAIESARAGEAGKGFAVVSQEIRKLAERSKSETNHIEEDIKKITSKLHHLSELAESLNYYSAEQDRNVALTKSSFGDITDHVISINQKMDHINQTVSDVNKANQELTVKLEGISAISEETAASTEEVSAASENQKDAIGHVNIAATELQDISLLLEQEVLKFHIGNEKIPQMDNETSYDEAAAGLYHGENDNLSDEGNHPTIS